MATRTIQQIGKEVKALMIECIEHIPLEVYATNDHSTVEAPTNKTLEVKMNLVEALQAEGRALKRLLDRQAAAVEATGGTIP